ncbi:allantoinase AllB [Herbidospora mongoliensis]|uniref:allantoinase AllB n=1 Tax=Herbidospora mongoliensis TaxID=688067 RepID=UPI000832681D|nr:allantoinase AllB [Herbidospora mongoliensis]
MTVLVRSRRVVTPEGVLPLGVDVVDGRIAGLVPYTTHEGLDLGDVALLPGLVDTHVHINEPGRTHWEGFATATRAAAAGGVTTVVDMPLNSLPPTTTVPNLEIKKKAAYGQIAVDVGFWGGAIPGNLGDLRPLWDAGVFGVKCFLSPSGVDEFPALDANGLTRALQELARFDGLLIAHAEDPWTLTEPTGPSYSEFLDSRTQEAEVRAIETVIAVARETGARAHIVHVSAGDAIAVLREAQAQGVRITAETCPHYLTLSAEEVTGTAFKCCPPIREAANRDALWAGLADGTLMGIVSDHSPCPADMKGLDSPDFVTAWGGISSLQLGLPAIWTEASARGFSLEDVVRWMARGPADFAGLSSKGRIEVGADADLVAFDPEAGFVVEAGDLAHKNPVTAYQGRSLKGVVQQTWLRGDAPGHGRFLTRGAR